MTREKLFDAMTEIREETLKRAEGYGRPGTHKRKWWISAVAAVLVVAIGLGILLQPNGPIPGGSAAAIAEPDYPTMTEYPGGNETIPFWESKYNAWRADIKAQQGPKGYADGLEDYFTQSIATFLSDADGENLVYSPVNVYMALAMLAETCAGESRGQILDLLGHESIESLREQAGYLWNANYRDDGATTSILASSLWLDSGVEYVPSTIKRLAKNYYASVFQGDLGSEGCVAALKDWINEQTGGLLKEQVESLELDPEAVLALASTVYFKAKWNNRFNADRNTVETFHSPDGDIECEFMNSSNSQYYFWGDIFSAVSVPMENAGSMYLILPDEGYTVKDLLKNEQAMGFVSSNKNWENKKHLTVNLSLPKFDISSNFDLKQGLKKLGVTDVFNRLSADFSQTVVTDQPVWVNQVEHAARVTVDEDGVEAAAYTVIVTYGAAMPPDDEVDFVLDRPFLFVLTGIDGLPLFTGVVNQPV